MTVSSDKLSDMSDPKLLLSLTVAKADGSTEEVLVELPRDDLYGVRQRGEPFSCVCCVACVVCVGVCARAPRGGVTPLFLYD